MPDSTEGKQNEGEDPTNVKTEDASEIETFEEIKDSEEKTPKENRKPIPVTITDIELEELKSTAEEYKDKYFRILAESENARKRLIKERQEMIQYTLSNLVAEFLAPIEQMDKALKHAESTSSEVKQWCIGFQMILTHFKDVLASNNVYAFPSLGKAFDPHLHEAVEVVATTEQTPGTIVEECNQGYKMGERVIRPARVKVAKKPEEPSSGADAGPE